jgi:hypothetical protein
MKTIDVFPEFNEEGEVLAYFGQARLIKYLDGKLELRGGSEEDRSAAEEWISLFCHEAVVGRDCGSGGCDRAGQETLCW